MSQKRITGTGTLGGGGSQTRGIMPKAAAATVAIRSINVRWCRDVVMLWLRRVELSAPLWFVIANRQAQRNMMARIAV
jgi:hypothetical protein